MGVPSNLKAPAGNYSLNWYTSVTPSLSITEIDSNMKHTLIPNRQLHISSAIPSTNTGRVNDYYIVIIDNMIRNYIKKETGWQDITSKIVISDTAPTTANKIWIKLNGVVCQKSTGTSWESTLYPLIASATETAIINITLPRAGKYRIDAKCRVLQTTKDSWGTISLFQQGVGIVANLESIIWFDSASSQKTGYVSEFITVSSSEVIELRYQASNAWREYT